MSNWLLLEEVFSNRVRVDLRRAGHDSDEWFGEPIVFTAPLSPAEREDLRWYWEDYLIALFAVYEEHGQAVQAKLAEWGQALFEAVFGAGKPGRDVYLQACEGGMCAVVALSLAGISEPALGVAARPTATNAAGFGAECDRRARCAV